MNEPLLLGPGRRDWTFRFYSAYAWGCPTLIVAVGVLLDLNALWPDYAPSYGSHLCWISNRSGLGLFFVAPVTLLLVQNVILFIMTVRSIWSQRKAAQFAVDKNQTYRPPSSKENPASHRRTGKSNDSEKNRVRFLLYIKLALIMGLAWGFGFIAALARIPALWYPFIFFNALQGAFIFIAFDCKKKIWFLIYLVNYSCVYFSLLNLHKLLQFVLFPDYMNRGWNVNSSRSGGRYHIKRLWQILIVVLLL